MNSDEALQRAIMRRVRFIYYMRRLSTPLMLELGLFAFFGVVISLSISIPSIIRNISMLSIREEGFSYIYWATLNTKLTVQIVLLATIVLLAVTAWNMFRNFRGQRDERVEAQTI